MNEKYAYSSLRQRMKWLQQEIEEKQRLLKNMQAELEAMHDADPQLALPFATVLGAAIKPREVTVLFARGFTTYGDLLYAVDGYSPQGISEKRWTEIAIAVRKARRKPSDETEVQ